METLKSQEMLWERESIVYLGMFLLFFLNKGWRKSIFVALVTFLACRWVMIKWNCSYLRKGVKCPFLEFYKRTKVKIRVKKSNITESSWKQRDWDSSEGDTQIVFFFSEGHFQIFEVYYFMIFRVTFTFKFHVHNCKIEGLFQKVFIFFYFLKK